MNIRRAMDISGISLVFALVVIGCKKGTDPCSDESTTSISPNGKYEAKLTMKTCGWGFGMAAESAELKVTQLGESGWFYTQPLEYDSINSDDGCPPPTLSWTGPNELRILVTTRDTSGRLIRQDGDLSVTREYVVQSKKANHK